MTILEKLDKEISQAMKARNQDRLACVRLIKSAVKNKEIEFLHPLSETEFYSVLSSMVKQRHESIEQFKKGGRSDLVAKEEKELEVISGFLPKKLLDSELEALINQAITSTGAKGPRDMGNVMKALKDQTAGRVDGKILAEKVRSKLS